MSKRSRGLVKRARVGGGKAPVRVFISIPLPFPQLSAQRAQVFSVPRLPPDVDSHLRARRRLRDFVPRFFDRDRFALAEASNHRVHEANERDI